MDVTKVKKLREFDTPTVANGLGLMGVRDDSYGYTGPDIRHLMPEMGRRVGVAVTARMDTTSPGIEEWEPLFDDWLRMMAEAGKGDGGESLPVFAVIESVGPRPRYTVTIGDGMATRMRMAGAEGYLTNGCIRDLEGVREVPLACWAAGLSPMHGQLRWLDIGSTVVIDGMTVKPGDILHADVNGVVTIPADAADQVYDRAAEVAQKEAQLFARLRAPGMTLDKLLSP